MMSSWPGVTRQQRLERRQQGHEEGRVGRAAHRLQPIEQRRGQHDVLDGPARCPHDRAGSIGRKLEDRCRARRAALASSASVPGDRVRGQRGPLPPREVRVLQGQGGQRRRAAGRGRFVELGDLAEEHAHRPGVGDDVVHEQAAGRDRPDGQAQQRRPQERAPGEVERPLSFLAYHPLHLGFALRLGRIAQIDDRQLERTTFGEDLHRLSIDLREGRAQRLVARDDSVEAVAERRRGQWAEDSDRPREVVRGRAGIQPVEEPEPLLGVGDLAHLPRRRGRPGGHQAPAASTAIAAT